jgi:hypothetical protein
MPEIDFFSDDRDENTLVQFIMDQGFYFVPDVSYDFPDYNQFRDWDSYQANRLSTPRFYLLHRDVPVSPLLMHQIRQGWRAGKYALLDREGGPVLDLCCGNAYEKNGFRWLPTCSLSYHPTYVNSDTGQFEKTPKKLRSKYRDIANYIKQHGTMIEQKCIGGGTRSYWIMEHARNALRQGSKLGVKGLENLVV